MTHSSDNTTFVVTDEQLQQQLSDGSTWKGNHRVWSDPQVQVITNDGARTPQQVVLYLATHRWVDELFNNCGVPNCITGLHNSETKAHADSVRDAEDNSLIQAHTAQAFSLAALYRKGKSRGLLGPTSTYGG